MQICESEVLKDQNENEILASRMKPEEQSHEIILTRLHTNLFQIDFSSSVICVCPVLLFLFFFCPVLLIGNPNLKNTFNNHTFQFVELF